MNMKSSVNQKSATGLERTTGQGRCHQGALSVSESRQGASPVRPCCQRQYCLFASPGKMWVHDLRRGQGVFERTRRGGRRIHTETKSERKRRSAMIQEWLMQV